jgi:hypothetical protein
MGFRNKYAENEFHVFHCPSNSNSNTSTGTGSYSSLFSYRTVRAEVRYTDRNPDN